MSLNCQPCYSLNCVVPVDVETYSLDGLPPAPLPPSPATPRLPYGNETVYFSVGCAPGETASYSGTLPNWITLDTVNNRFVGASGYYRGTTRDEANESAQAALNQFGQNALDTGSVSCTPPTTLVDWSQLLWSVPSLIEVLGTASFTPDSIVSDTCEAISNSGDMAGACVGTNSATVSYNGTGCNCTATVTKVTSGLAASNVGSIRMLINIGGIWTTLLTYTSDSSVPDGTVVVPFSVPDTGGVAGTILVDWVTASSIAGVASCDFSVTFANL